MVLRSAAMLATVGSWTALAVVMRTSTAAEDGASVAQQHGGALDVERGGRWIDPRHEAARAIARGATPSRLTSWETTTLSISALTI